METYFDYIERLSKFVDNHNVAKGVHKTNMIKDHFIQTVPDLPRHLASVIRLPSVGLDDLPEYIQNEMHQLQGLQHIKTSVETSRGSEEEHQQVPDGGKHTFPSSPQKDCSRNFPISVDMQHGIDIQNGVDMQYGAHQPPAIEPTHLNFNYLGQSPGHDHFPAGMQNQPPEQYQYQQHQQAGENWQPEIKPVICRKCRQEGHYRKECVNGSFCSICERSGHQNRSHKRYVTK